MDHELRQAFEKMRQETKTEMAQLTAEVRAGFRDLRHVILRRAHGIDDRLAAMERWLDGLRLDDPPAA